LKSTGANLIGNESISFGFCDHIFFIFLHCGNYR